jgi:hypothetical protein
MGQERPCRAVRRTKERGTGQPPGKPRRLDIEHTELAQESLAGRIPINVHFDKQPYLMIINNFIAY